VDDRRDAIRAFLGLEKSGLETPPSPAVIDEAPHDGFRRKRVSFVSEGERLEALLFEPAQSRNVAVVMLHQHNSQWHLGKSEVAGLAYDSVGFESRRGDAGDTTLAPRIDPSRGSTPQDWLQYYNHAMHRLAKGELLMAKLLTDVAAAVNALRGLVGHSNIGVAGHSHGGTVALFAAALDTRVAFAASSGAVCSYRHKFGAGTGLDMALVLPGFAAHFDFEDLVRCVAPRPLLVVSSEDDPYAADAGDVVDNARAAFTALGATECLQHLRTPGPHALDQRRFDAIVEWLAADHPGYRVSPLSK